jgi:hypothetical protein
MFWVASKKINKCFSVSNCDDTVFWFFGSRLLLATHHHTLQPHNAGWLQCNVLNCLSSIFITARPSSSAPSTFVAAVGDHGGSMRAHYALQFYDMQDRLAYELRPPSQGRRLAYQERQGRHRQA